MKNRIHSYIMRIVVLLVALVYAGTVSAQSVRAYNARKRVNDTGNILIIANTLLTSSTNPALESNYANVAGVQNGTVGSPGSYNDTNYMINVDVDPTSLGSGSNTFNNTSAKLALPTGATVTWAGLYWGARTLAGGAYNSGGLTVAAGVAAKDAGAKDRCWFRTPAGGYSQKISSQTDDDSTVTNTSAYQCFVDVTSDVQSAGSGDYYVANVQAGLGSNRFAGWTMVVIYHLSTETAKNLTVFDGYSSVSSGQTLTLPFSGFNTPPSGTVNATVGFVGWEGDRDITGDGCSFTGNLGSAALTDALSPTTNFWRSLISNNGVNVTTRNPSYVNNQGIDARMMPLPASVLGNSATSATVTCNSTGDQYFPGVITTAIDLYAPKITATKLNTDLNGNHVTPGDILQYDIGVANDPNPNGDGAANMVLIDQLPPQVSYVPNSISVSGTINAGTATSGSSRYTDVSGDDLAEVGTVSGTTTITVRLGTGALAGSGTAGGGVLAIGGSTHVTFLVQVNPGVVDKTIINNQAQLTFSSLTKPIALSAASNTATVDNSKTIEGVIFEDVNYGGGVGRAPGTSGTLNTVSLSGGQPVNGVTVELYDGSGNFVRSVVTGTDSAKGSGVYDFYDVLPGDYTVRVVSNTIKSSRAPSANGLLPVQTYTTACSAAISGTAANGAAVLFSGSTSSVLDQVGGANPLLVDAAAAGVGTNISTLTTGSTAAQSVVRLHTGINDILHVDFGYNFDTVVNNRDSGQGSLRQFIVNANTMPNSGVAQAGRTSGIDNAIFMIPNGVAGPGMSGSFNAFTSGYASIALASVLPTVTESVVIDGATQPGYSSIPVIEINGAGAGASADGLKITAGSSTINALAINRCSGAGINLATSGNDKITGNYLGTDPSGNSALGNNEGLLINGASGNTIGGTTVATRNVISGNAINGIRLTGAGATSNLVKGNYVGVSAAGSAALANGADGVRLEAGAASNTIGGTTGGAGNLIAGNTGEGIQITGASTASNLVQGNQIGLAGIGNGGSGVRIDSSASGNAIGGTAAGAPNTIVGNGAGGVVIGAASSGNPILRNSIYGNTGSGIDLSAAAATPDGVTPNNGALGGAGNNGMDYPVFQTVTLDGGSLTLTGFVGSGTGQSAFGGATIELYKADNSPADQDGLIITSGSVTAPHGEGRTYITTITAAANGTFNVTTPVTGLSIGDLITATATSTAAPANNTSEFSADFLVAAPVVGGTVSGFVYKDVDRNGQKNGTEAGTGLTLYAKIFLSSGTGPALSGTTVDPTTGAYSFSGVLPGSYTIVINGTNSLSDVTPAYPAGWTGVEYASGVHSNIAVTLQNPTSYNFGVVQANTVSGIVFTDTGTGGGTANNGTKDGGEKGIGGATVSLTDSTGATVYDKVTSAADGTFALTVSGTVPSGTLKIVKTNPVGDISTGANVSTLTSGTYDRPSDTVTFSYTAGSNIGGLQLGVIPGPNFLTDGQQAGLPGTILFYPHSFTLNTSGTVTFSAHGVPTPAGVQGWSETFFLDANGNGKFDSGEAQITGPITVTSGTTINILVKEFIPNTAPMDGRNTVTVSAVYNDSGATPALSGTLTRTDLTVVGNQTISGLVLNKSVDLESAKPGDTLTYTLVFSNNTTSPLSNIIIHDSTPTYTTFLSGTWLSPLPNSITAVSPSFPAVGASGSGGTITWTMTGQLDPAATGTLTFQVKVAP